MSEASDFWWGVEPTPAMLRCKAWVMEQLRMWRLCRDAAAGRKVTP